MDYNFEGGQTIMDKHPAVLYKTLVVGVIVLFVGVSIVPAITANISDYNKINITSSDEKVENQNNTILSFYTFDNTGTRQNELTLSDDARYIFDVYEELKYKILYEPKSEETQQLKIRFVDLLDEHGLIPEGLSKEDVLSMLNPYWLNAQQRQNDDRLRIKAPVLRFILSNILKNRINLRQLLKNWFGKTNFNSINNNPLIISSTQNVGTAIFCVIISSGLGVTLPIIVLPRPRVGFLWLADTQWSETLVGEFLIPDGFWARGSQVGIALGFIGLGFTLYQEGVVFYDFIGYAVYTRVIADEIEDLRPPEPHDIGV